jgi:hypothetical protein
VSTRQKQHRVTILGGSWELQLPDGAHFTGSVESGTVRFPRSLAEDLGCGPGVTKVSAIFLFDADAQSSHTKACLDDRHDLPTRPPIWGRIGTPHSPRHNILYSGGECTRPCLGHIILTRTQSCTADRRRLSTQERHYVSIRWVTLVQHGRLHSALTSTMF